MTLRSMLFVPGDSERKLARSYDSDADALILDLEDSVMPENKAQARLIVRSALDNRTDGRQLWVRINSFDSGELLHDLAAIVGGQPDVVILPKANSAADLEKLDLFLQALEVRENVPVGQIKAVVVATETGPSVFNFASYTPATPRLFGLTWGAEDLSAAVGARSKLDANGNLAPLYVLARSLCIAGAAAAETLAIDTACMAIRDEDVLRAECEAAQRDGFRAKLAIHPDQVGVINEVFTPKQDEIEHAQRIVALFEANPGVGAFNYQGQMIDIPHLKQARKILAIASPSNAGRRV